MQWILAHTMEYRYVRSNMIIRVQLYWWVPQYIALRQKILRALRHDHAMLWSLLSVYRLGRHRHQHLYQIASTVWIEHIIHIIRNVFAKHACCSSALCWNWFARNTVGAGMHSINTRYVRCVNEEKSLLIWKRNHNTQGSTTRAMRTHCCAV